MRGGGRVWGSHKVDYMRCGGRVWGSHEVGYMRWITQGGLRKVDHARWVSHKVDHTR